MEPRITHAEQALFEALSKHTGNPSDILIAGNRSGRILLTATEKFPEAKIRAHVFDYHHARAIRNRLSEAGIDPDGKVFPTAFIPNDIKYDLALFMTTPQSMPAELVLDQLEDIHASLAEGGVFYAAFEGDGDEALKTLKKVWGTVGCPQCSLPRKRVSLFRMVKHGELAKRRSFEADWESSVPGGEKITFTSLPGCFCHRRPDEGGLALAEVASREVKAGDAILDMGCGCGLVGILVADAQRRKSPDGKTGVITFIDSHARAVEMTKRNAERAGLDNLRLILDDEGLPREEVATQDLFVGNPPYYSDYRIAETFLETAYRTLKPGGICLTVVKTATGLLALQEKYFQKAEVIKRRGYCVLKSIR